MSKLNFFIHRTAAVLASGLNKKGIEKSVLAFSFGGGSVDVSLLHVTIDEGVFEVLATSGDTNLGGEDINERIMNFMFKKYKNTTGIDIRFEHVLLLFKKETEKNTRLLKNYNANLIIIIMTKNVIKSYMIIYVLSLQFVIKEVFLYCNYYNNTVLLYTISFNCI